MADRCSICGSYGHTHLHCYGTPSQQISNEKLIEDLKEVVRVLWPSVDTRPHFDEHIRTLLSTPYTPTVETTSRPAPEWAYADKATGEVWIGEFDDAGNWIPPQRPAVRNT